MGRILSFAALAAAAVYIARREWRRVNQDLDRTRGREVSRAGTLRRDHATGEWRPSR